MLYDSDLIKLTKQLIERQSITPNDAGCQSIIANRLKKIGFKIKQINFTKTSNLIAWRGTGKTLAFSGHTDVIPSGNTNSWHYPPFKGSIHNNIMYGRGVTDMKGAIAAMIIAVEQFIHKFPTHKGKILFLITSDEEGTGKNGTKKIIKYLINQKEQINYCLVGEPSSKFLLGDTIKNGRRGSLTGTITIYGVQGHVAYPNLINNPIHTSIPILNNLISKTWDSGNEIFPPTTMQIISINSPKIGQNNLTPEKIKIKINFRFNNISHEKYLQNYIEKKIKKYNTNTTNNVVKWNLSANPYLSHTGKLTNAVIQAIQYYQKTTPNIDTSGGSSDGRHISYIGSEIIELGLINKTIHKINECTDIKDLHLLSLIYKKIIEHLMN